MKIISTFIDKLITCFHHAGFDAMELEILKGELDHQLDGFCRVAFAVVFLIQKIADEGALQGAAQYLEKVKLHRIEAGVMPRNLASIRVLEKAGFHKEGIARKNVKINGKWEDHQLLAVINPND